MTNKTELLPCPFCNSSVMPGVAWAQCSNSACPAFHIQTRDFLMWNTRAAHAEDVRAVGDEPMAPETCNTFIRGWLVGCEYFGVRTEAVKFIQSGRAEGAGNGTELHPLYFANHTQRQVVLPKRRNLPAYWCWQDIQAHKDCEWNKCIAEVERLNK